MVLFCTIILLPDKQLKAQVFVLFDLIAHVGFLDSSEGDNLISSANAYLALRELFQLNIKEFFINQGNCCWACPTQSLLPLLHTLCLFPHSWACQCSKADP